MLVRSTHRPTAVCGATALVTMRSASGIDVTASHRGRTGTRNEVTAAVTASSSAANGANTSRTPL
jgi:hypothetical protein